MVMCGTLPDVPVPLRGRVLQSTGNYRKAVRRLARGREKCACRREQEGRAEKKEETEEGRGGEEEEGSDRASATTSQRVVQNARRL